MRSELIPICRPNSSAYLRGTVQQCCSKSSDLRKQLPVHIDDPDSLLVGGRRGAAAPSSFVCFDFNVTGKHICRWLTSQAGRLFVAAFGASTTKSVIVLDHLLYSSNENFHLEKR